MIHKRLLITRFAACTLMLAGLMTISFGWSAPRAATDRPNVVVILLDDAGYGDFSLTGNPTIRTPQLERMAREGLRFRQFYCATAACSASRYSLLTGRNPGRSGLGKWVIGPDAARHLHPRETTLAEGLRARGYRTAMFGKWHLGTPNAANGFTTNALPLAHGFEQFFGLNVSSDYEQVRLIEGPAAAPNFAEHYRIVESNVCHNAALQSGLTRAFSDRALAFIHANRERPFFVYLPFTLPHLPLHASAEFQGRSPRGLYGDVMEELDAALGRVLDALVTEQIAANTLVLFTSDNGPWIRWRSDGKERLNVGDSGPFRDGKGSGWEGGVRVPGVFWWPGTIAAGTSVMQPASTLDVLPTVFRLAGEPLPADRTLDGRDVTPLLSAKAFPGAVPEFRFFYTGAESQVTGVRRGSWKLHTSVYSQLGDNYGYKNVSLQNPLLFQVEQDPGERFNLAADQPSVVRELQDEIQAFQQQSKAEGSFWKGLAPVGKAVGELPERD
jgi:arylsulfatase A